MESCPSRAKRSIFLRQDADLAFHLVYVDANMLHGWPPPLRHTTACTIVGLRPPRVVAASRFIPSTVSPRWSTSKRTRSGATSEPSCGVTGRLRPDWRPSPSSSAPADALLYTAGTALADAHEVYCLP